MRSASTVLLYDVMLIITQEARKVKCCHGCGWAIKSKNRQTKRPAINDWSYRSPGRARTYNNSVNSRVLCHWATEDYGIRQRLILPGRVQPSTFSTGELNCCVRDGNRWNLSVIATGNGSYLIASPFSSCFHFSLSFYLLAFERERSKLKGGWNPSAPWQLHIEWFFRPFQLVLSFLFQICFRLTSHCLRSAQPSSFSAFKR